MPTIKDRRLSEFNDKASEIVEDTKWRKKYGKSTNLGQSIAKAMESAYQQGKKEASQNDAEELPLMFIDVPRRFRVVYEYLGFTAHTGRDSGFIEHCDGKAYAYHSISDTESSLNTSYAMSNIKGLLKLGVIETVQFDKYIAFQISSLGKKIYYEAVDSGLVMDWRDKL